MSNFDPRIQVQATLLKRSWLDVAIAPYALQEALTLRIGMVRKWFVRPQEDIYGCEVLLQVLMDTESGQRAVTAEVLMEQVVLVQGYDDETLADVLELKLHQIMLPYVRAQMSELLHNTGYQHVTLPYTLPGADLRAVEVDAQTREPLAAEGATP
jgi:preprotein translocase subunit SecB